MNDQTFSMQEACEALAIIVVTLAAKDCAAGIRLARKGRTASDRDMEMQGLQMMLENLGPLALSMEVPGVDAMEILRMELEGENGDIAS